MRLVYTVLPPKPMCSEKGLENRSCFDGNTVREMKAESLEPPWDEIKLPGYI
jgi:hypothetical protein